MGSARVTQSSSRVLRVPSCLLSSLSSLSAHKTPSVMELFLQINCNFISVANGLGHNYSLLCTAEEEADAEDV